MEAAPFLALCICFLCSILLLLWRWRCKVFSAFKGTNIPGPAPSSWLWGNLRDYWNPTTVQRIATWHEQYGDTFGFYLGDRPFVVTKDLNLLKHVLIKDFNNFEDRGRTLEIHRMHPKLSSSLIFVGGKKWKMTRSCMTQAFSTVKIRAMMAAVDHAVDEFLRDLEEAAEKDVEVSEDLADLTFDIIGKGAFGIDTGAQKSRSHPIHLLSLRTHPTVMSGWCYDVAQSLASLPHLLKLLTLLHGWVFGNPITLLADQVKPVIERRKRDPSLRRPDMLQNLVEAEIPSKPVDVRRLSVTEADDQQQESPGGVTAKHMSPGEVCVNSTFVFLAGFDTTRQTLTYWAFYVAKHPDVQAKMRAEVQEAVDKHGQLTYDVISGLHYSKCVVKETLRISPPVPTFTTRCAKEDYRYKDMVIRKGTSIMASTYEIHHDPDLWPDPEVFDPERFVAGDKEKSDQLAFVPFGAGPKNCLGMRFAMLESVYAAARILLQFQLSLADRQKPELEYHSYGMMLGPKDGVWLRFQKLPRGTRKRPAQGL